jgi:hypothetical protein
MSELYRFISQQEYEAGVTTRLELGAVAVGMVYTLRMKGPNARREGTPMQWAEAAIHIHKKVDADNGAADIYYAYEIDKIQNVTQLYVENFSADSIARSLDSDGHAYETYLSDKQIGSWDNGLETMLTTELVTAGGIAISDNI